MQRHKLTQDKAKVQTQKLTQHKSFASKNKICTWWVLPRFFYFNHRKVLPEAVRPTTDCDRDDLVGHALHMHKEHNSAVLPRQLVVRPVSANIVRLGTSVVEIQVPERFLAPRCATSDFTSSPPPSAGRHKRFAIADVDVEIVVEALECWFLSCFCCVSLRVCHPTWRKKQGEEQTHNETQRKTKGLGKLALCVGGSSLTGAQ